MGLGTTLNVKALGLIFIMIFLANTIWAQSSMPPDPNNFLQITGQQGLGSYDRLNVVFFEVPDTETSLLYFAVFDPGVSNTGRDQVSGPNDTTTTHYLVGGSGCLSNSNSTKWYYSEAELTAGQHLTGIVLGEMTYPGTDADGQWVYFAGVLPSQGEHIGNKYYFKVVSIVNTNANEKNAYRLDLSSSNSGSPTTIPNVRSFAYSLSIYLTSLGNSVWNLYPFVPKGKADNYLIFTNLDMDEIATPDPTGTAYNKDDTDVGPITISGNGQIANTGHLIASGQDNGFWRYYFTDNWQADNNYNTSEIWCWTSSTDIDERTTIAAASKPAQNQTLRLYSAPYAVAEPDHVVASFADDGIAAVGSSERIIFQLVDASGEPQAAICDLWVDLEASAGSPQITAASNALTPTGSSSILVCTDATGLAWVEVSNDAEVAVTLSVRTDGTGSPPCSDLANIVENNQLVISFITDLPPSLSSASNLTFIEGNAANLPQLTITERGLTSIRTGVNVVIRIPAGLQANFDTTGADPTLGGTLPATYVGRTAGTVTIQPGADAVEGNTITISGLRFTNINSASTGRLELSYDNGVTWQVVDDKLITIVPSGSTFIWTGSVSTDWNNSSNWSPSGVPNDPNVNVVIPAAPSNRPHITTAGPDISLKSLTIASGASLTVADGRSLTLNGSINNNGILTKEGAGSLSFLSGNDSDSGTIAYSGDGAVFDFGPTDYYHLVIGPGRHSLGGPITVVASLSFTGSGGILDLNGKELNLSFDLELAPAGSEIEVDAGSQFNLGTHQLVLSAGTLTQTGGNIQADSVLVNGGSYTGGGAGSISLVGGFSLSSGGFSLGNVELTCNTFSQNGGDFNGGSGRLIASGSVTISNGTFSGGTLYLSSAGNVNVSGGTHNTENYTLEMTSAGTSLSYSGGRNPANLVIDSSGSVALGSDLSLTGSLTINTGNLTAGSYTIRVSGNWINHGSFTAGTSTVEFVDNSQESQIEGNNSFYKLRLQEAGKTLRFEAGSTQTILAGGSFIVRGSSTERINLRSSVDNPDFAWNDPSYTFNESYHWRLTIAPGATALIEWAYVECSYATYAIYAEETSFHTYDWCYNWRQQVLVEAVRTIDLDHNGRIDRLELEISYNTSLNDDFNGLTVTVSGYQKGIKFSTYRDENNQQDIEKNDDTFYVVLESEAPLIDTGWTPRIIITSNSSLKANTGQNRFVGPLNQPLPSQDKAEPLVGYSLAVAGGSEVFIYFTEDLNPTVNNFSFDFGAGPVNPMSLSQLSGREVLLNFGGGNIFTTDAIVNAGTLTYADIADVASNPLYLGGGNERRVSDLILTRPGYEPANLLLYDNNPVEPGFEGIRYLSVFDGTGWITDPNATWVLEVTTTYTNAELLWFADKTSHYTKIPLWYPDPQTYSIADPIGLVTNWQAVNSIIPSGTSYEINFGHPDLENETIFEFYLSFSNAAPGLLYARLTRPTASDWYRSVRPFAFGLHKPLPQKGGVEIFKNVINPERGERTLLQYSLKNSGQVTISIFTLNGDLVRVLFAGRQNAGSYSITWDGRNASGQVVARGLYFIKIVGPGIEEMRKVLVVK